MATLAQHHWQAAKTLLGYPKETRTHGLLYKSATKHLLTALLYIYSDADFANAKNGKSITGKAHLILNTPISWESRKQYGVTLSTTEAKYISATSVARHSNSLRKLLTNATFRPFSPTPHYIDNCSAMLIATNRAPTKLRKYIHIRHHYLQHPTAQHHIVQKRIPTTNMLADILTKPLHREHPSTLRQQLNITPCPIQNVHQQPGTVNQHNHSC